MKYHFHITSVHKYIARVKAKHKELILMYGIAFCCQSHLVSVLFRFWYTSLHTVSFFKMFFYYSCIINNSYFYLNGMFNTLPLDIVTFIFIVLENIYNSYNLRCILLFWFFLFRGFSYVFFILPPWIRLFHLPSSWWIWSCSWICRRSLSWSTCSCYPHLMVCRTL